MSAPPRHPPRPPHMHVIQTISDHDQPSRRRDLVPAMDLNALLSNPAPELVQMLSSQNVLALTNFLVYAPRFKDDILIVQDAAWPVDEAPLFMPPDVNFLLARLCEISEETSQKLWFFLKDLIWSWARRAKETEERFKHHGRDLSYRTVYPREQYCSMPGCLRTNNQQKMQKAEQTQAVLYTLGQGVQPVWVTTFYCQQCHSSYHQNYRVHDRTRYYYSELPELIEVTDRCYVERRVINSWCTDMNISWKSATNCARAYVLSNSDANALPDDWPLKVSLKGDHVYSAFVILSLLEDCKDRNEVLTVPDKGDQKDRFKAAIHARNARIKLSVVSVVVMDGVTIGRPRCAAVVEGSPCKEPLDSTKERYCPRHRDNENVCVITGCERQVIPGSQTCDDASHQETERLHRLRGQSRFQLQERLQRARVAHPNDSVAEDVSPEEVADEEGAEDEFEVDATPSAKSDTTTHFPQLSVKKRLRAQFGRKRTHNEQVIVSPCGVILARDTFYGAEGISSCAEFIRRTFRINGQMPNHIFFDNNCQLAKHVRNDPLFAQVGLSVDVFHFSCKHSTKDVFCSENCNPALFPELGGKDRSSWYFNSSIAEQTNVWLGGFHSILREMQADLYDFYLDEMIIRRNRLTVDRLRTQGHCPFHKIVQTVL